MAKTQRNNQRTRRPGAWTLGAVFVLSVVAIDLAAQSPTPAGTQIANSAEATYVAENGVTFTARSNLLVVIVGQVGGVDLAPPRFASAAPGTRVVFAHTVTNVGNGTDSVRLAGTSSAGWPVTLYHDLNGDGVLDAGDAALQGPVTLAASAQAAVLAVVDVPAAAAVRGMTDSVAVTATSEYDGAGDAVLDVLDILTANVQVAVAKLVDRTTATASDVLTYTVSYTVSGTAPATGLELSDSIPLGTTYVSGSMAWNGVALSDATGDDAARFEPGANRVVFALGDQAPGQSGTLAFQVRIDGGLAAATPIPNQAVAIYGTQAGPDSVTSNAVVTTVVLAQLALEKTLVGPASARIGEEIAYTMVAVNRSGTTPARDVMLYDTLPPTLEFVSATPQAAVNGAIVSWTIGEIAPGDSVTVALTARVSSQVRDTTTVRNVAVVASSNAAEQSATSADAEVVGLLPNQLGLVKSADVLEVGLGETVPYTLVLENTGDNALSDLRVVDSLPEGGRYAAGSAMGADSIAVNGRVLTFFVAGPLAPGATHTIRYAVAVVSAPQPVLENRAYATAEGGFVTSVMQVAWVRLRHAWPLETRAVIGKAWLDLNDDGVQSTGEPGVGGLDVWTDDGEVATTDEDGKFSFQNVRAGGHAFRLDPTTVPAAYSVASDDRIVALDAGGWTTPIVQFRLVPRAAQLTRVRVPVAWSLGVRTVSSVASVGTSEPASDPSLADEPDSVAADMPALLMAVLPVTFEDGRSQLTSTSLPVLNHLAALLDASPEIKVDIAGHTSSTGSRDFNLQLSFERATAVADFLTSQGVSRERLDVDAYGPDRPVASNDTPDGQARNRRVELYLANGGHHAVATFQRAVSEPVRRTPPSPPVARYAVDIANPGGQSLEGLAVRFGAPVDSASVLLGETAVALGRGPLTLPPVAPGARVTVIAWSSRLDDTVSATLEVPGQEATSLAVPVRDSLTQVEGQATVGFGAADLPSLTAAVDGPVKVTLAPAAAAWPEQTFPLLDGWEPVPGSVRLGGAPAADPAVRTDPSGRPFLHWHFGSRPPGPITLELRPIAAAAPMAPVVLPALRADSTRDADGRKAFLFGPTTRIFGLADGTVTARDRVFIGVRGEAGQPVTLYDGDTVLARGTIRVDGVHDFVAVPLSQGPHRLRVAMRNTWNQERWDSIAVHVSGLPASIEGPVKTLQLTADGQTVAPVRVRLLDAWGVPVVTPTHVGVNVDGAEVLELDSDPSSVGLQLRSDSLGWLTVDIKPGFTVTRGRLTLAVGDARYERALETLPAVRPLMVTAVGRVGVGAAPDAYGAITARGRLDDRTSVVLSVDSRRLDAGRENFGRDYDPLDEAQYPILGDASSVRTLSASRNAVSARVERGFDWIAVGDVATGEFGQGLSLATYRRALSGGMAQITTGRIAWRGFASLTNQSLQQEQIRGAGISGPYPLAGSVIPTSEQMVVETRDRENPQRVVTRQALVRFIDYQIDYQSGTLLFKRPVPAVDENDNPVFLVVTYEGRGAGDQQLVGGLRASIDARPRGLELGLDSLRVGVSAIHADEPTGAFSLTGLDLRLLRFAGLDLGAEISYAQSPDSSGLATSLTGSADLLDGALQLSAAWMKIGDGFGNPSNIALRSGTEEITVGGSYRLPRTGTTLRAQHEFFNSASQGVRRRRSSLGVMQPIGEHFQIEASNMLDGFQNGADADRSHAVEGRLSWTPSTRLRIWAEGRQQLSSTESLVRPNQIGAGVGFKVTEQMSVELRHRLALLPGDDSYEVTNIGLRSELGFGTQAWGSYQLAGGAGAQYNAAVVGLNNRLRLGSAWTLNSMFERRVGLSGADPGDPVRALPFLQDEEDYWSLGAGVELLPADAAYRASGRGEYRDGDRLSTRLFTLAGDVSINRSLAILSRQELLRTEQALPTGAEQSRRIASLWGVAFRPIANDAVHVLTKFSWLDETNPRNRGVLTSLGQEQRLIGAAELIWTPTARLELATRYAIRRTEADRLHEDGVSQRLVSTADYAGTRAELRLNGFLTFRSEGRLLIERASGTTRWDAAPSLAVALLEILEVSAGYRFGDLRDPDFAVRGGHGGFVTLGTRITEGSLTTVADFWRARFGN